MNQARSFMFSRFLVGQVSRPAVGLSPREIFWSICALHNQHDEYLTAATPPSVRYWRTVVYYVSTLWKSSTGTRVSVGLHDVWRGVWADGPSARSLSLRAYISKAS